MTGWIQRFPSTLAILLLLSGCSSGQAPGEFSCPDGSFKKAGKDECTGQETNQPTDTGFTPNYDATPVDGDRKDWEDDDGDGRFNQFDNCPGIANPNQKDRDSDGVGDPCDNCRKVANADQIDTNEMKPGGDACDDPKDLYRSDRNSDGDMIVDIKDNCPNTANQDQKDQDGDFHGDACDNCPTVANIAQTDSDGMAPGDACAPKPAGPICRRLESDFERFSPNIYILLDKSGSMSGAKINDATKAIVEIARNFQGTARFGLTAFSDDCAPKELLAMGQHNAAGVQNSFSTLRATGNTGTAGALKVTRQEKRFLEPGSSGSEGRPKAVLLITDGAANRCGGQSAAESEAKSLLSSHGVKTHVVGFQSDAQPSNLDAIASAGGTSGHIQAQNKQQLISAMKDIFTQVIGCTYELPEPMEGIDGNKIWVQINGTYIDRSQYSYDPTTKELTIDQSACDMLQQSNPDPLSDPIEIEMGCPSQCKKSAEICDYKDNDCDGKVDPLCDDCFPEVCDGKDNDCDTETDEGCPDCEFLGESCETASDCCSGTCQSGTCRRGCRPIGTRCNDNGQCCSGVCGSSGSNAGTCVGG